MYVHKKKTSKASLYLCSSSSKKLMNWIDVTGVYLTETKAALVDVINDW